MEKGKEVVVFISGCYDIIHGGHIEFFKDARALGTKLILHIAGDKSLWIHKGRTPSIPLEHKLVVYRNLSCVDEVMYSKDEDMDTARKGLDFEKNFRLAKPDILAVTKDDRYEKIKRELCKSVGTQYKQMEKGLSSIKEKVSTTKIIQNVKSPTWVALRVDFGGGWLDVPKLSRDDGFIVNCSIIPGVSTCDWNNYEIGSGLGGSAAKALLEGGCGVEEEIEMGVGWQDPAIIRETGLCVWQSGQRPHLLLKRNPMPLLSGKMSLLWCYKRESTPGSVDMKRDYSLIVKAGKTAKEGVEKSDYGLLCKSVNISYKMQVESGLKTLKSHGELAKKYCGSGGYALYLWKTKKERDEFVKTVEGVRAVEPYIRGYRKTEEEERLIQNGKK